MDKIKQESKSLLLCIIFFKLELALSYLEEPIRNSQRKVQDPGDLASFGPIYIK